MLNITGHFKLTECLAPEKNRGERNLIGWLDDVRDAWTLDKGDESYWTSFGLCYSLESVPSWVRIVLSVWNFFQTEKQKLQIKTQNSKLKPISVGNFCFKDKKRERHLTQEETYSPALNQESENIRSLIWRRNCALCVLRTERTCENGTLLWIRYAVSCWVLVKFRRQNFRSHLLMQQELFA